MTVTGFPEVTDGHGVTVNPRSLKLRSVKVSLSLADLNEYRAALQEFLYSGKANGISIDFAQNKINLQVSNKTDQEAALDFLRNHGISSESVNFTIGTIINTKTLFDSFRPAVGGVNVVYGSSNATIPPFFACTLGLSVLVDTIEGYLTASHCSLTEGVSNDGSALYQAGTIIGNKTLDNAFYACTNNGNPAKCKNADTAFYKSTIPITRGRIIFPTGGIGSILTASTNGDTYYDVTAVAERVGNGEVLSSIGASGGYRTATVTNWNYDSVLSPTANTFQILKGTVKVSNTTNFGAECTGDSGGPWFQITGSTTAKFAGIAAQADTPLIKRTLPDGLLSQCLSNGYFSPVAQIRIAYPGRVFQFTR